MLCKNLYILIYNILPWSIDVCVCVCVCGLSCAQLFATPWTVAHQAHLSMGFPRQEYWSGLTFPPLGDLPHPGIKLSSPALQVDSLPVEPLGKPKYRLVILQTFFAKDQREEIFSSGGCTDYATTRRLSFFWQAAWENSKPAGGAGF